MKWIGLAGSLLFLGAAIASSAKEEEWSLLIGGGIQGYLSPCGCTEPMQGGIRRKVSAYQTLTPEARTTRIELGPLSSGSARQDELKIEATVEALAAGGVNAISFSAEELRFGAAMAANLGRISRSKLVSSGFLSDFSQPSIAHGPFLIGSWDPKGSQAASRLGLETLTEAEALSGMLQEADLRGLLPVLLLEDGIASAKSLAQTYPSLAIVVFRSKSSPPASAERVGRTLLITSGPQGKSVIHLTFRGGDLTGQSVVNLDPSFSDDSEASRIFLTYKRRVKEEKLLEMLPRTEGAGYAGSKKCTSCHQKEGEIWRASEHSHALKTLEVDGSDRDPDCVGCHVVGLSKKPGFRDRASTPQLADVGCESCHGPGLKHSASPRKEKMAPSLQSCVSCHNSDHSPQFDEAKYWAKIAH